MRASTVKKYYGERLAAPGWTPLPHLLRRHYRALGLEEETFVFVLHLIAKDWDVRQPPGSLQDIAQLMDKNIATVRRYSQRLNDLGLLRITPRFRHKRQISNHYDLTPLWAKLLELEHNDNNKE